MEVERVGGHLEALTLQVWVWVCVCICVLARGRGAHLGDVAMWQWVHRHWSPSYHPEKQKQHENTRSLV